MYIDAEPLIGLILALAALIGVMAMSLRTTVNALRESSGLNTTLGRECRQYAEDRRAWARERAGLKSEIRRLRSRVEELESLVEELRASADAANAAAQLALTDVAPSSTLGREE